MSTSASVDPELIARLPLPLAQVYRRAGSATRPQERHLVSFYLWEASLKLLCSTALALYLSRGKNDPALLKRLESLARPSLGQWWEFARLLVGSLADAGDPGFAAVRDLLLGRARDDLPRVAGLDAALVETLEGKAGARATVRPSDLFDRLVRYRNREMGHGAAAAREAPHHERLGRALLAGVPQLLQRLDVLAGRRLVSFSDVRLLPSGHWLGERYELKGEHPVRLDPLELPDRVELRGLRPLPEHVYLDSGGPVIGGPGAAARLVSLHPLLWYDFDANEAFFLSACPHKARVELLSYTTGRTLDRADVVTGQQEALGRLLDLPVAAEDAASSAECPGAEEPPAEEPPAAERRLGEFELLSVLGRGGMGVVYKARQPSLGREVAVKKLFRVGDPKAEARFAREIRALGKVEHPHLVKVFASEAEGDQWFYAMELIEGATLAAVAERLQSSHTPPSGVDWRMWHATVSTACAEARRAERRLDADGPPPPAGPGAGTSAPRHPGTGSPASDSTWRGYVRQVVELVRQVAGAAHALHEAGVVHRDIKPGNIMVRADGTQAVLMDLGLAQLADEEEGKLTRSRQFVGTLRYASPEQVRALNRVDRRSDVYSLGATLWELLTLRTMFGADESTPAPELMRRIELEDVERPRRYHPGLGRDLEAIVLKCLEKDPRRRYGTAQELADDLERYQQNEVVRARPVRGWERGWKWARRHPALTGFMVALVLLVAVLAGGVVVTGLALAHARAMEGQAEADKKRALEEGAIAQAVTAFLQKDVLGQADMGKQRLLGQYGAPGDPNISVRELLDRAAPAIEGTFKDQPEMEAEIRLAIGDTYRAVLQYEKARPHLERALALYRQHRGEDDPGTLGCKNDLAVLYHAEAKHGRSDALLRAWRANYDRAERLLLEVVDRRKERLGADDPDTLASEHNLALLYYDQTQYDRAEPLLRAVLEMRLNKLGPDDLDTLQVKNNLGMVYYDQDMLERAEPLWAEVVEKFEKKLGAEDVRTLACKGNMADLYRDQGKYDRAEPLYRELGALEEKKLGPDHTDTLKNKRGLAWLYDAQGKYDDEEKLLTEVLRTEERTLGPEDPLTLREKGFLGQVYSSKGQQDRAEQMYQEALAVQEKRLGPEHPDTVTMKLNLAGLYKDQGKYDRAEALYREALDLRKQTLGADHLYTLLAKSLLAGVYLAQGKYDLAGPLYREAAEQQEKRWGVDHPWTVYRKNNLAAAYRAQQKYDRAEALYREVLDVQLKRLGAENSATLDGKNNLAAVYQEEAKYDQAEALYREVLRAREKAQGPEDPDTLAAKDNLAGVYRAEKKYDRAEALGREALEARKKKLGAEDPATLLSMNTLAWLYQDQGKYDRAEPLLADQLAALEKTTKKDTPEEQELAAVQSQLGLVRVHLKKYAEAEVVLRAALAVREKAQPDEWTTFNTKALLGAALAGQKKFEDAEKLLLQGYEGMKAREDKIPPAGKPRLAEAGGYLVGLYEAWDKKDKAEEWRKTLAKKE